MARLGIIANNEFQKRLLLLTQARLSLGAIFKIKKLVQQVDEETKRYNDMRMERVIMPFAELDEEGKPVLTEDGNGVKIRQDSLEAMSAAMTELNDIEVDLIRIPLSALEKIEDISYTDLVILSDVIDENA